MSSFTAVCFSVSATAARSAGFSSAGSRASASVNADAAPALANARECAKAPLAGSRGSSPVVSARAASHAALSAAASTRSRMTATMGTSTEALTNAPLHASHRVDAAATTRHADAAGAWSSSCAAHAGQTVWTSARGSLRRAYVSRASSAARMRARVSSAEVSDAALGSRAAATDSQRRAAAWTAPARTHAAPQPGTASSPVISARRATPAAIAAVTFGGSASTAATKSRVAFAAGCSPRPSGPAYDL